MDILSAIGFSIFWPMFVAEKIFDSDLDIRKPLFIACCFLIFPIWLVGIPVSFIWAITDMLNS